MARPIQFPPTSASAQRGARSRDISSIWQRSFTRSWVRHREGRLPVGHVAWQGTGCTTGTVTMTGAVTCTAVFQALPCDPDGSLQRTCQTLGGTWNSATCSCSHINLDPLMLTLDGGPLALTDLAHGVRFDMEGTGSPTAIAWTTAGAQVAFLALDVNGNGVIDTGAEVFAGPPDRPDSRARSSAGCG